MSIKALFSYVVLVFLFAQIAAAQEDNNSKIFIKLVGGYAFLGPGSFSGTNTTRGSKFEESKQKFGQGVRGGIGFGYIINENINIGLDLIYHKGANLALTRNIENQRDSIGTQYIRTTNSDITTSYNYNILNIIPNITFKAISKPAYYVYNRIGVIIGLPLDLNTTYIGSTTSRTVNIPPTAQYDYTNSQSYNYDGNYSEDPALGFQAALGVQFIVSGRLRIFTELEASSLVLIPKELIYTTYTFTSTTTKNLPLPQAVVSNSTDKKLRNYYYQKNGQLITETKPDRVDIYTSRIRLPTNSLSLNAGVALRF